MKPEIARTWLLVNAMHVDSFGEALQSSADCIVIDVEDAVDPRFKDAARGDVATWLPDNAAWVRINDRTSSHWSDDVDALRGVPRLTGVMLAKVEDPTHVTETFDRLGGVIPVVALIESALGIEQSPDIACARGAFRLAFGSGDYRRDTGASAHDTAMAYPRNKLVVASRIGNLPGPIDGPTVTDDSGKIREQTELAGALGMTGKLCIGYDFLNTINTGLSPSPSDIEWALHFLSDFQARGGVVRDGSDLPRLGRARALAARATALGISPH